MAFLNATCLAKGSKLYFAQSQSLLKCLHSGVSYCFNSYLGNELPHQHGGEAHRRGTALLEFY